MARYAWPAGIAAAGGAWYGADSLRHRRETSHGYSLRGEVDVSEPSFLRAAEAKRSIAKLAAMRPAVVFPGHLGPLTGPDLVAQLEAAAA